ERAGGTCRGGLPGARRGRRADRHRPRGRARRQPGGRAREGVPDGRMIRVLATIDPDPRRSRFELAPPDEPFPSHPALLPSPRRGGAGGEVLPRRPSVVAVGKFFAVHRGHQALITEAVTRARARGARSVALTFDRHPLEVLRPGTETPFLTTLAERL